MHRRSRRGLGDHGSFVLVANDPAVIAAAHDAARRLHGMPPVLIASGAEALSRLVGPGDAPRHLVLQGGSTEGAEALLSAARDRFSGTEVVVVANPGDPVPAGLRAVRAEGAALADALCGASLPAEMPASDAAALSEGLDRGEITVRFQPIVRLGDRRPVLVEALARWERPAAALSPGAFVPMAEGSGLAARLTLEVARRAVQELAAVRGRTALRLSFNVPLAVLLLAELPTQLSAIVAAAGLAPAELLLELTESTEVRDIALLRRALRRLDRAGFGVLLDDFALDDARRALLDLPFAGVKLDRSLVTGLPAERRARAEVEKLARRVHRQGGAVVAEGVTDPLIWRAATAAGCDLAQGFGVGRPLPPGTLSAWMTAWRAPGNGLG
jgi:EAL domain-containing protein (putative c-di-GMP-specific phosphodiesterase class I)